MPRYIFDDEDNCPMSEGLMDIDDRDGHNPTVYLSVAEMKYYENRLPFDDVEPVEGVEEEEPHYGNAP